ncbi:hypothetical protein OG618_03355 [Kitasatospora sp. NBC_01246]|uniref:hypothetical protein n=1 Tax=Kitasatospora sp. NBC_01246 TaxID=2903570 RepID=UPI002E33796A|nr:hypothetical protein [Kitasatospora sp. NBC_01246]
MERRDQVALAGVDGGTGGTGSHGRELVALVRRLGLGLRSRGWEMVRGVRPRTVLGLGLASLALLAVGLLPAPATVFWAFTGGWALILAASFAVLRLCAEGHRSGR